jgi:hypothetical protein
MEWVVEARGIESAGSCLQTMVDAFGELRTAISRLFADEGVGKLGRDGVVTIDPDGWYPIETELSVLKRMLDRVGEATLFKVGTRIPENTEFPPSVADIHSALQSLDVAYHLNHRKNGVVMFDPSSARMLDGIGHFGYEPAGERRVMITAPGPFPCEFNRGIVAGLAQRFQPRARVVLDASRPGLKDGAAVSTYIVTW